jgi:hypothetical protein
MARLPAGRQVFLPSGHKLSGRYECRGTGGLLVALLSWCFSTVLVAMRSVAVGLASKAEICHGYRKIIASSARIRVQLSFLNCLGSRNLFAKTLSDWRSQAGVTSQLTFIVRVSGWYYIQNFISSI